MGRLSEHELAHLGGRVAVPGYDRAAVSAGVVHLGVGGFHRSHQAVYHDALLRAGLLEWGICGVGVLPRDAAMRDALVAQDGLYTLLVKAPDGTVAPQVVGSIVEYLLAPDDPEAVVERLAAPTTRVVTLTITEGGYDVDDATGTFRASTPEVRHDLGGGPPRSAFGFVVEALRRRRERGLPPLTVLSCDNLEGNGDVARTAFGAFARLRDPELGAWVEAAVPFPNAVVDRITPATTDADRLTVSELLGVDDRAPVVCEPFTQWVIETADGAVLPPYDRVGARLVPDARPFELMKLRLLNAGHQVLAYFGRLLGHRFVHEAARDPDLRAFLAEYLEREAVPTLSGVPEADVASFRDAVAERFGNPAIGDTLARLAVDASDRIPKFVLPVIRERLARGEEVTLAAAVIASWARYAGGVDEQGAPIAFDDRRADSLADRARRRRAEPDAFIRDEAVFGDLARDERFAAPYRAALASLDERGARATLAALIATG
jgi:mannitol 2-dehydrogenase